MVTSGSSARWSASRSESLDDVTPGAIASLRGGGWLMTVGMWAYSFAVVFTRARAIVLEQEADTEWVRALR